MTLFRSWPLLSTLLFLVPHLLWAQEKPKIHFNAFSVGIGNSFDLYHNVGLGELKNLSGGMIDDSGLEVSGWDEFNTRSSSSNIGQFRFYFSRYNSSDNRPRYGAFFLGASYAFGHRQQVTYVTDSVTSRQYLNYSLDYNELTISGAYQYNLKIADRFQIFLETELVVGTSANKQFTIYSERTELSPDNTYIKVNTPYSQQVDERFETKGSFFIRNRITFGIRVIMTDFMDIIFRNAIGSGTHASSNSANVRIDEHYYTGLDLKFYLE